MLKLQLAVSPGADLELWQEGENARLLEIIDYWEHSPKLVLAFDFDGRHHKVEYTLAPSSFLHLMHPGEKFGLYVGKMMFISAEIAQNRPSWVPYLVVKLYAEGFADEGQDASGRVKHMEALFATIRWAAETLPREEFNLFLQAVAAHEKTGYFKLDHQVREYLERIGGHEGFLEARRRYLERHHQNMWVCRGRGEEILRCFPGMDFPGARNHSEAVFQRLSRTALPDTYRAALFVRAMMQTEPGLTVVVTPPDTRIAYLFTKSGNGLVDLVRFQGSPGKTPGEDYVVRLPGRERTWQGISRRLGFEIHRAELAARELIDARRAELSSQTLQLERVNTIAQERLEALQHQIATRQLLAEAVGQLASLGESWGGEATRLQAASAQAAGVLDQLERARRALLEVL